MKVYIFILLTGVMICMMNSCASLAGFQDGKTLGEGNVEISPSLNLSKTAGLLDDTEIDEYFVIPYGEFSFRYGASKKVDIGGRINTLGNIGLLGKFQIVGDESSKNAFAIGAEVGNFAASGLLWNIQIPLYFSTHPNERTSFYLSPKYIYQVSSAQDIGSFHYYGGNIGFLIGSNIKYGLDLGYFLLKNQNSIGLFTIGFGAKFRFST